MCIISHVDFSVFQFLISSFHAFLNESREVFNILSHESGSVLQLPYFLIARLKTFITISSALQLSPLCGCFGFCPSVSLSFLGNRISFRVLVPVSSVPKYTFLVCNLLLFLLSLSTPNPWESPSHFYCKYLLESLFSSIHTNGFHSLFLYIYHISWLYSDRFHSTGTTLTNEPDYKIWLMFSNCY